MSNGFEVIDFKIGIFWKNYLKNCNPYQKVLEVWPPKSEVSKAKWGFWGSKKCFGPPKLKKWFSQKNPKSVICQNIGGGQGSGPSQPDVVGSLGSICPTISRNQEKDKYDIWAVFILRITVNGPFQINLK